MPSSLSTGRCGGCQATRRTSACRGRRFGVAEHHADFFTQLVDEHHRRLGARDATGQLPECLAHEPRLQAHVRITHVSFDFRLRYQCRNGVDDDDVDRTRPYQNLANLERLLARVGLRDQHRFDIDAELSRVVRVERVLCVDIRRDSPISLGIRDDMQTERLLPLDSGP